jgi:hypothetical protein
MTLLYSTDEIGQLIENDILSKKEIQLTEKNILKITYVGDGWTGELLHVQAEIIPSKESK